MSVVRRLMNVARGKAKLWKDGDPHDPSLADEPLRQPAPAEPEPEVAETPEATSPEPPPTPRKRRL